MNTEYICKMLAILNHDKINVLINKKGYLVSTNKLSNYDLVQEHVDLMLANNYALISQKHNELTDKLIMFLQDAKISHYLSSQNILSYSIIKVDIDYIINIMFKGFNYIIIGEKVVLTRTFNSEEEASIYLNSLYSKKKNVKDLFAKFNLQFILVFNIITKNSEQQFIIDTTYNKIINSYALNKCIDDNLMDFDNDTLILGVTVCDDWRMKKNAILESKMFLLNNVYPNFNDIKVRLCDYNGNFIDEFGEILLNIGYSLSENENIEETKLNNHLNAINTENKTQKNNFIDEHKTLNKELHCLEEAYNYYISNKISPTVHINKDLTKHIKVHDLEYINKIKVNAADDYNNFLLKLESYNDFDFKINIIHEKINFYYDEVIPF